MGIKLYGIDVSGIINKEIGGKVLTDPAAHNASLRHFTVGTRTGNLTGGTKPTHTDHTCKGFIDSKTLKSFKGTLVSNGHVFIVLIGDSIAPAQVPVEEDQITIEAKTYWIKVLDRDPAAATYTCMCKGV
jgi:hypothetical protein